MANRLKDVKAELDPGERSFSAFLTGSGDLDSGFLGAGLRYSHRPTDRISLFAEGTAGYKYGLNPGFGFGLMAGIEGSF